jgi:hypothetical protein
MAKQDLDEVVKKLKAKKETETPQPTPKKKVVVEEEEEYEDEEETEDDDAEEEEQDDDEDEEKEVVEKPKKATVKQTAEDEPKVDPDAVVSEEVAILQNNGVFRRELLVQLQHLNSNFEKFFKKLE